MPDSYLINPGDVCEVTMVGTYQASQVLNVFHYYWAGGIIPATDGELEVQNLLAGFENIVWDAPVTGVRQRLVSDYTLLRIKGQMVYPNRRYYSTKIPANSAGVKAPPGIPSDTNLTVSLRTARATRGTTGNKKFTALPLSTINGAVFTDAERIAWSGPAQWINTPIEDLNAVQNWIPLVWSRKRPLDTGYIIGLTPEPEVRVLRRRELGKGV